MPFSLCGYCFSDGKPPLSTTPRSDHCDVEVSELKEALRARHWTRLKIDEA